MTQIIFHPRGCDEYFNKSLVELVVTRLAVIHRHEFMAAIANKIDARNPGKHQHICCGRLHVVVID
jgi:hypothetical protein